MSKPNKEELRALITTAEAWAKKQDKRVYVDPLTMSPSDSLMPVPIPDIPAEYVEMARRLLPEYPAGNFPALEQLVEDPGDPAMTDVVRDFQRALGML